MRTTLIFLFLLCSSLCQANVITEAVEHIAKHFAKEATEAGGEAAVKQGLKKLVARYGEEILPMLRQLGPKSIQLIEKYSDDGVRILNAYGADGLTILSRCGDEAIPLARLHGDDIIRVYARHPGLGKTIFNELGQEGLAIARKLTSDEMVHLLRAAPRLREQGRLATLLAQIEKYGVVALKTAIEHPLTAVALAGGTYLYLRQPASSSPTEQSATVTTAAQPPTPSLPAPVQLTRLCFSTNKLFDK